MLARRTKTKVEMVRNDGAVDFVPRAFSTSPHRAIAGLGAEHILMAIRTSIRATEIENEWG